MIPPTTDRESEFPCTCGTGTMFYSYLHPADCPFSRAGVVPPKSREQKLADLLKEIAAAARKVRDAEYAFGLMRYSTKAIDMHFQRDEERQLHEALQRLCFLATEADRV